ncbi:MAG TPA: hypothetical protein VGV40_10855 [Solirubrobacteraceae bacterium]|nr:hypothetical protein [Solirubrobacteraceae bacterium]
MSDSTPDTSTKAGTGVPRGDDPGYPVVAWHVGQPIPDLALVTRERWRETMLPLTVAARGIAVGSRR